MVSVLTDQFFLVYVVGVALGLVPFSLFSMARWDMTPHALDLHCLLWPIFLPFLPMFVMRQERLRRLRLVREVLNG